MQKDVRTSKKKSGKGFSIDLSGRSALVTGGSRGIGKSVALALAACGADVAFVYKKSDAEAKAALAEIASHGKKALAVKCDAADPEQAADAVKRAAEEFGGLDILVNNVAVSDNIPFLALEYADWKRAVSINIDSLYNFTHPALLLMKERKYGRILNIGSVCGVRPIAAVPVHYAATKAAVNAFTYTLAREVARYNITVNSVAPGLIETDFAAGLPEVRIKDFEKFCPAGRIGSADEVARVAVFLLSDLNTYMTGETVTVSGGL